MSHSTAAHSTAHNTTARSTAEEILAFHERTAEDGLSDPVRFAERFGAWFVHGYDDVRRVLTDHETFSSDELRYSARDVPHRDNPLLRGMSATDPPRHRLLRRSVARAFTPGAVAALRPSIAATAGRLLDRCAAVGGSTGRRGAADAADAAGAMDVIGGFASPLPVTTIATLLGVEPERRADFVRWTEAITSFAGQFAADGERRAAFDTACAELGAYFRGVFAERRRSPREDVVSTLLAAEPDGARLTDGELLDFLTLLLINGHETTKTLLVNSLLCLARRPSAREELRARPALVPRAVEEVLRYLPPTGGTDRFTTRTTGVGGRRIGAGARVIAVVASANRDPRVFSRPNDFDIHREDREANPHLSFGRGVHFCLGAQLARTEAEIGLRAMLERLPGRWRLPEAGLVTDRTPVGVDVVGMELAWDG